MYTVHVQVYTYTVHVQVYTYTVHVQVYTYTVHVQVYTYTVHVQVYTYISVNWIESAVTGPLILTSVRRSLNRPVWLGSYPCSQSVSPA